MVPNVVVTPVSMVRLLNRCIDSERIEGSSDDIAASLAISNTPPPDSASSVTSATTSLHAATREATGRSSAVRCLLLLDVEKPMAPAVRALLTSVVILSRSSAEAASSNARSPIAQVRRAECPMYAATLIAFGSRSTTSRYSSKCSHPQWEMPSARDTAGMSSARSRLRRTSSDRPGRVGARVNPQLPVTTVVTPCQHDDVPSGSQNIWASRCV